MSFKNLEKTLHLTGMLVADKVEIINSFTGKTVCNKYSRLTKQSMFRRFARITGHLPGISNRSIDKDYGEEKSAAIDYQVKTVECQISSPLFFFLFLECKTRTHHSFSA